METKQKVFNLIVLDESGSMGNIKDIIISGFNELVQTIKGIAIKFPEQEHFISFVSFNGLGIKTHHEVEAVNKLNGIDATTYEPNSNTPLYDALGFSIAKLRSITDKDMNCNVLVTILTDGEENASKEFNGSTIKILIEELTEKNWTFTYIGTDHDVDKFASSLSIKNSMKFEKNEKDMKLMFEKEKSSYMNFFTNLKDNKITKGDFFKEKPSDKK